MQGSLGTVLSRRITVGATVAAALLIGLSSVRAANAQGPTPTPTPRVLIRDPFGISGKKSDTVIATVGGAIRDARALGVKVSDFGKVVGARSEVNNALQGARDELTKGAIAQGKKNYAEAVTHYRLSVVAYEQVGADVWRTEELAYAYVHLGIAFTLRDAAKKSEDAVEAFRHARILKPDLAVEAPDFDPSEIAIYRKAAAGTPPPAGPPSDGFFALARTLGLDGLVEVKVNANGRYALRVHRITKYDVTTTKIASKGPGLDAAARRALADALGFGPAPVLVAVSTTAPTPVIVPNPTPTPEPSWSHNPNPPTDVNFFGEASPTPTAKPVSTRVAMASTPAPTPTPVAVRATPTPMPEPTSVAPDHQMVWMGEHGSEPVQTPGPTPEVVATPAPTPTMVAVATPRPTPAFRPSHGNGANALDGGGLTTAPPGYRAPPSPLFGNGSWAQVLGGTDHRASIYSHSGAYSYFPSGDDPSASVRVWVVAKNVWAVRASAGGIKRAYLFGNTVTSGQSMEGSLHLLRSDDERGRWWIGGGVSYLSEPEIRGPADIVPKLTRIVPSAIGVAQFSLISRLAIRLTGTAGVALDSGDSSLGSGVGYDAAGEAALLFAISSRLHLAAGGDVHRGYAEFNKTSINDKITDTESRRAAWAGIEAAF